MDMDVKELLGEINLQSLENNFESQKIDSLSICQALTTQQLERLGLTTMGDQVLFQTAVARKIAENNSNQGNSSSSANGSAFALFRPSRSSSARGRTSKKKRPKRTWTATFFCLSGKNTTSLPLSGEKIALAQADLGQKKIQFDYDDSSEDVRRKIIDTFKKLKNAGGFEIMTCQSNCRKLAVINCSWDVQSLKSTVSSQTKIYIRPIQNDLAVEVSTNVPICEEQEQCQKCNQHFPMNELRKHVESCNMSESDGELHFVPDLSYHDNQPVNTSQTEIALHTSRDEIPLHTSQTETSQVEIPVNTSQVEDEVRVLQTKADSINNESGKRDIMEIARSCIDFCRGNNISESTDILRYLQSVICCGRPLEIVNEETHLQGDTNYIMIDRTNVLETAFTEIQNIDHENIRLTLEVQFYEEAAEDMGGPRKEFFGIILREIFEKYFNPVREFSGDYEIVGKILALSLLQNGKLPRVLGPSHIDAVFKTDGDSIVTPQWVKDLRKGLDSLGIYTIASELPVLVHFFTLGNTKLTYRMMTHLLKAQFSEEGSNRRVDEKKVYTKFLKYMREAGSGRRPCDLKSILRFVTSSEEEPCLGFALQPSINFVLKDSFVPTASTCVNKLNLTIPTRDMDLPEDDVLFNLFDLAFCNNFYGLH